jgi:hypothetical protein
VDHESDHPEVRALPCPPESIGPAGERREAGIARVTEGALLCADAAVAFERGAFADGVVLTARAAEAMCEGAALLGVGAEGDRLRGVGL